MAQNAPCRASWDTPISFLCCLFHPDSEICDQLQTYYLIYFILMMWWVQRSGVKVIGSHSQAMSEQVFWPGSGWTNAAVLISWFVSAWRCEQSKSVDYFIQQIWFQSQLLSTNQFTICELAWKIYLCIFHMKSLSEGKYLWRKKLPCRCLIATKCINRKCPLQIVIFIKTKWVTLSIALWGTTYFLAFIL